MSKERLYIFDTTLRDGAQKQGVHFSIDEKTKIAHALDNLGVDYIEFYVGNAKQSVSLSSIKTISALSLKKSLH